MAVIKWMFVLLFGVAGAGALGLGVLEGAATRSATPRALPAIALREFPSGALAAAEPKPAGVTDAPVAEKPEPVAEKPEPVVEKPAPVAEKPAPVAEKPAPVAEKPAPVAEKPAPVAEPVAEKPKPAPPPPPAEGLLNLRASDTADVFLDGKKVGGSPLLGVKAKVGSHKVRFDCYDAAGNTVPGAAQSVVVKADAETDVEFTCPAE